ncbi:MAG TPA: cyanophycin synthetase, partial [Candidatus Limnocylindrales bacterium]|nr:cyanophycin synthetase [Candidatus Limnocylindrales bacterium]
MTRTSDDIGQGLAAARQARPIAARERIHVVGAAGAGASAAALLAHHAGATVTGCDPGGPSPYTAALQAAGIPVAWEHDAAHVAAGVDRLAVTKALTSVDPGHPELHAARAAGVPLEPWQQVVADAAATSGQRLVAIAGTHGKSTTTGWLVDVLMRDGRDPSAFVGALLPASVSGTAPATARWGNGDLFVVEADEYAGNFDPYRPSVALLLNAEWDHPDVFADDEAVLSAFEAWIRHSLPDATLVANMEDPGVARIVQRLSDWPGEIVAAPPTVPLGWDVGLPGPANADNARMVIGAARVLGVTDTALREGVADYVGVGRRMEVKGDVGGVVVIDDYGHHPTAIAKTLEAVRSRYPGRRVWAVYEPLTYHRTAAMLGEFARVLAAADEVAIADIWAGRDPDTTLTSASALAEYVRAVGG